MTAASPWSVKGIDPKAREMAKDLARRSGMTLGEWLNQMITEGDGEAPPFEFESRAQPRPDIGYRGIPDRDYTPAGEPFSNPAQRASELQRITRALDNLSARMEAAEHRSTLAISGIDQSVMGVLSRFESVEREQGAVAARFDDALEEVREAQIKAGEKVRRLSEDEAPRVEAMKALEAALGKVAEKLYEGDTKTRGVLNELREDAANLSRRMDRTEAKVEAEPATALVDSVVARITARLEQAESKTSEAVKALEVSFAGLDERLKASETNQNSDSELKFEQLTAELSDKVQATRTEMAERLRDAADGTLGRMEGALRDLAGHVEQGERRSAHAIDRIGREVMRVASTMGERVTKVEARSAEAVEQVGGEMARIAEAIEQRMGRQDAVQAQALEKLGAEIGRIAEKLAERISNAERRSTQSVDDVGEQLGRVTERLNQRHDRANSELADRIQQSEERTARLVEDVQGKIDARLTETQRRVAFDVAAETVRAETVRHAAEDERAPEREPVAHTDFSDLFAPTHGASTYARDPEPFASEVFINDPFAVPAPPFVAPESEVPASAFSGMAEDAFHPTEPFAETVPEPVFSGPSFSEPAFPGPVFQEPAFQEPVFSEPAFQQLAFTHEPAPISNREMVEQARATARNGSERSESPSRRGEAVEAPPLEGGFAKAFSFGSKKKKAEGITLRTALLASGTAAAVAVTLVGGGLLLATEQVQHTDHANEHFGIAPTAAQHDATSEPVMAAAIATPAPNASGTVTASTAPAAAQMAVAITPHADQLDGLKTAPAKAVPPVKPVAATALPEAFQKPAAAGAIYSAAVRKIESNDLSGLEDLKKAANLGHPAAQFYLAKLYETGGAGLKKDLTEARRWTERAAAGGDVAAMHNLGLYYYEGEAGAQDSAKAAQWFQKAASQGVKDSQFNLALLYAKGNGVAQNPAEAYKWYLIAAAAGDEGAKTAAQAIRSQLTPETQAAAERSAAAFHAQALGVRTASAATP